ncbi:MAG: phytanoyl-CoA dioxygenase family protein [Phycisphaerales bacterium]|nr:phytanoyl-CoA dioxygenase family protein [Phycisphaerales bacterium]
MIAEGSEFTVDRDGFAILRGVAGNAEIAALRTAADAVLRQENSGVRSRRGAGFAARNLLGLSRAIRAFATGLAIRKLVEPHLGAHAQIVRSVLFDKNSTANWLVPWHQDTAIAVRERSSMAGYGPWSVKAGVIHVRPPAEILERMLTVRVHLDDAPAQNGALHVIPGSHRCGLIETDAIDAMRRAPGTHVCECGAGDALLMRPLLLHASYPAANPTRRRVLHFEFAACALPHPLSWADET